jgi:hypothetical protein
MKNPEDLPGQVELHLSQHDLTKLESLEKGFTNEEGQI